MYSLVAAAACLGTVGCSQNTQLVRGQQPEYCPPGAGAYNGDYCEEDCDRHCHGPNCCCCQCRPYCIPNDLVYPPPGDQPAIVQYPYYTCKGPDCFFHPPLR
jgi:hypothetical protein